MTEAGKYISAKNMVTEKFRIAKGLMEAEMSGFLTSINLVHTIESIETPFFTTDTIPVGVSGSNPGLKITKIQTALSQIYVPRIYFKAATDVTDLDIIISDGVQTELFTISAVAGEEVVIDARFVTNQNEVTIIYDSSNVEAYSGPISSYYNRGCCGCCSDCGSTYLTIRGIDEQSDEANVLYGIRADVQLICDQDKIFCLTLKFNQVAFLYCVGELLMQEAATSDRLNFLAMSGKEMFTQLSQQFGIKWRELILMNSDAIQSYLLRVEKNCFDCKGIQYGFNTP